MKAPAQFGESVFNGQATLEIEPDILALGKYLAEKQGMTLNIFLEQLITREASRRKPVNRSTDSIA
jgi:hypothetical protein